jgi:hypothetical protein
MQVDISLFVAGVGQNAPHLSKTLKSLSNNGIDKDTQNTSHPFRKPGYDQYSGPS